MKVGGVVVMSPTGAEGLQVGWFSRTTDKQKILQLDVWVIVEVSCDWSVECSVCPAHLLGG